MKTITIEAPRHQVVADTADEVLVRLQSEVDQAVAEATAQAEAEARRRAAAAQKAAEAAPASRVRFAHD
jgi:plasmid maintenance system antidote protein VapI